MADMKKWCQLNRILWKQYIKKHRIFLGLLFLTALFLWVHGSMTKGKAEELRGIEIGVCAGDENGRKLLSGLKEEEEIFRFLAFEDEEEMIRQVENGTLECAYVLPENFYENMAEGKVRNQIILYYSPGSGVHKLSYEVVFSHLFSMLSGEVLKDWLLQGEGEPGGNGEEALALLNSYREKRENDGSTFTFRYETVGTKEGEEAEFLDSFRGCVSVAVFLLCLVGLGNCCDLRESSRELPKAGAVRIREINLTITAAGGVLSGALLLAAGRRMANPLQEAAGFLLYFILLEIYMRVLLLFFKRARDIYSLIPVVMLGCILFCPVFFKIETYIPYVSFIGKLFPPYWYLNLMNFT